VVKIAVSIPDDVFAAAEAEARRRGLNRSALYTEALRQFTMSRSAIDAAIVAGYEAHPQDNDLDVDELVSLTEDLGTYRS
jgi:predicted transcriptional regulator